MTSYIVYRARCGESPAPHTGQQLLYAEHQIPATIKLPCLPHGSLVVLGNLAATPSPDSA